MGYVLNVYQKSRRPCQPRKKATGTLVERAVVVVKMGTKASMSINKPNMGLNETRELYVNCE